MMKKYNCFSALCLAAALAFTACTQDELADDTLPEGKYPLEIASVAISAESSVQPWGAKTAQTRVLEEPSGAYSEWELTNEFFHVKFDGSDKVGIYQITNINVNSALVKTVEPAYWQSASQPQTIIAWYAPDADADGKLDLADQSKGLIYAMRANQSATYNNGAAVSLKFYHQLAKVRVVFSGGNASKVDDVKVEGYTSCTVTEGTVSTADAQTGYITTRKRTLLTTKTECWEATVAPGCPINKVKVNGATATITPVTPAAGQLHTITIDVKPTEIDLSTYTGTTLTVSGETIIKGDGTEKNLQITVEPDADVTLQGINLAYTGQAVIVCKGDATLTFSGTNALSGTPVASNYSSGSGVYIEQGTLTIDAEADASLSISRTYPSAPGLASGMGIYVGENANLVIKNGNISIGDVSSEGDGSGAGIGSYGNCGNITIEGGNITVGKVSWYAAGIGSVSSGNCKNITITGENTVVSVQKGSNTTYCIGPGRFGAVTGTITIGGGATVNNVKYTETHDGPLE